MPLSAHLHLVPSGFIHVSLPYLNAQHYEHADAEYHHHMPDRCEGQLRGGETQGRGERETNRGGEGERERKIKRV
jgi:hypothetical protein